MAVENGCSLLGYHNCWPCSMAKAENLQCLYLHFSVFPVPAAQEKDMNRTST